MKKSHRNVFTSTVYLLHHIELRYFMYYCHLQLILPSPCNPSALSIISCFSSHNKLWTFLTLVSISPKQVDHLDSSHSSGRQSEVRMKTSCIVRHSLVVIFLLVLFIIRLRGEQTVKRNKNTKIDRYFVWQARISFENI